MRDLDFTLYGYAIPLHLSFKALVAIKPHDFI